MRVVSIVLIILLVGTMVFGFAGCHIEEAPQNLPFKLMSYNMRVNPFTSGDKRVEYDSVRERAHLILQHIAEEDPDIICVQEWTPVHEMYVKKGLKDTYAMQSYDRGDTEMCAIFFKESRFELVDTEVFWLSETPNKASVIEGGSHPRIYASVVLRDKNTNKQLRIATTHLEIAYEALEKQRKMVVDYTAESNIPALVCGDFNLNETSKLYPYCTRMLDDCRLVAPGAVTTATYNGYNLVADDKVLDSDGNVLDGVGHPIDHIFIKKHSFEVLRYDVLNYLIDGMFSSDHFPLVVELKIND